MAGRRITIDAFSCFSGAVLSMVRKKEGEK
jgi:hypothetical protein